MSRGQRLYPVDPRLDSLDHRLLPLLSRLVPREKRSDWVREWQAEFWHLRHGEYAAHRQPGRVESLLGFLSLGWGLVADAAWVGTNALKEEKQGSAQSCLFQLVASCLICSLVELSYAGTMRALLATWSGYFVGRFMLVMLPAIFVALATMPSRPRKCNRGPAQLSGILTAHARWSFFLITKVALSVMLGFLLCVLISIPVRKVLGHNGDWIDVITSTVMLTTSLRLALDDQKQRCHKCLRLLRQPVRVGPPSYNLLNWNGTEMVCAEGHGMLQVPEMQGSWCWYDLWVEVDPAWHTALSTES